VPSIRLKSRVVTPGSLPTAPLSALTSSAQSIPVILNVPRSIRECQLVRVLLIAASSGITAAIAGLAGRIELPNFKYMAKLQMSQGTPSSGYCTICLQIHRETEGIGRSTTLRAFNG
jgi:hypothetical protein